MSLGHEYREAESLEDIVWLVKDFGFYSKGDKVSEGFKQGSDAETPTFYINHFGFSVEDNISLPKTRFWGTNY